MQRACDCVLPWRLAVRPSDHSHSVAGHLYEFRARSEIWPSGTDCEAHSRLAEHSNEQTETAHERTNYHWKLHLLLCNPPSERWHYAFHLFVSHPSFLLLTRERSVPESSKLTTRCHIPWHLRTSFNVIRSKVKVIRSHNARRRNVLLHWKGRPHKLQSCERTEHAKINILLPKDKVQGHMGIFV